MSFTNLPTRKIGDTEVSAVGYGSMGLSAYYGSIPSFEERLKACLISCNLLA